MAKKKCQNQNHNQGKDDGAKKDNTPTVVVLKVDLHCEGCATKIKKSIKSLDGVESVKGEYEDNKLTVIGSVDPSKLKEMVEKKSNKKVEIISPSQKKNNDKEKEKNKDTDGEEKKKKAEETPAKQQDKKKSKEPQVTTVVLKLHLHCEGCIRKIRKVVSRTKGYLEMSIDHPRDLVIVKGTMDGKALAESLKERLKKNVEIVPPKKEGGGENGKGGGEKGKGGGAKGEGGGEKAIKTGGGDGGAQGDVVHKLEYGFDYPYPVVYGSDYSVMHVHAPQVFSDENPNACSVM